MKLLRICDWFVKAKIFKQEPISESILSLFLVSYQFSYMIFSLSKTYSYSYCSGLFGAYFYDKILLDPITGYALFA